MSWHLNGYWCTLRIIWKGLDEHWNDVCRSAALLHLSAEGCLLQQHGQCCLQLDHCNHTQWRYHQYLNSQPPVLSYSNPIPSLHSLQLHSTCPLSWWTVTWQWSGWTGRGPSPSMATWESSASLRASWGSILVSTANYRFPVLHRKVRHTYLPTTM